MNYLSNCLCCARAHALPPPTQQQPMLPSANFEAQTNTTASAKKVQDKGMAWPTHLERLALLAALEDGF